MHRKWLLLLLMIFSGSFYAAEAPTIVFEGLPKAIATTVENSVNISTNQNLGKLSNIALYVLVQQGQNQLKQALKPFGYYRSTISISVTYNPWVITYHVTPGEPVLVKTVNVLIEGTGKENPVFQQTINANAIALNQPLSHDQYTTLKNALLNTATANGYFDARLTTHQIRIDLSTLQATILLTLATGEQYHFSTITLQQSKPTFRTDFLQRFNPITPSQPYSRKALDQLQSNLDRSGYFSSVNLNATPDTTTKAVPLIAELTPTLPQQYTLGGGYGTDTGPRLLLGWKLRHITDTGQYFTSELEISQAYSRFLTSYVIPGGNPMTDYTSINASQSFTNLTAYDARETLFGVYHVHQVNQWKYGYGLTQNLVSYNTQANSTTEHDQYLMPAVDITYTNKTQLPYWDQGLMTTLNLTGSVANPLSNATFSKAVGSLYYAHQLLPSNRFFVNNTLGGISVSNPQSIAPTLRFYAGGVDSLRGFQYQTVAPENNAGQLTGGKFLWVSQFNFEQHLLDKLSGILFYDVGNAFNSWQHVAPQQDAGFGISWQTPVGPIRAYLARALTVAGPRWQLSLGIGTSL